MAPTPSTTTTPVAEELCGLCAFTGTKIGWVARAMRFEKNPGTPLHRILTIAKHAKELTPHSEKITGNAVRAILAPMPLASLMDYADAKDCLDYVTDKVVTRAAKREAEAVAAAAAKEARLMEIGRKRAATRAKVAARPPKSVRLVEPTGRVRYE